MNRSDRIYIAPKRGRLPRRYEVTDNRTTRQKWRHLGWLLLGCALVSGFIWWQMT